MPRPTTPQVLENIDRRLTTVEQILPALATKDDLKRFATKEDLKLFATKEDLKQFATKEDMKAEGEQTRRHFDVVAESLRADIRLIAEGQVALTERMDAFESRTERAIANLDRRVLRLESKRDRP
jgi:hypothetical protein